MVKPYEKKCEGKFFYCSAWNAYTLGSTSLQNKSLGLGYISYTDIDTDKPTRNMPFLRFGKKYDENVKIYFCPFCGADYRKLGRV